ncbi:MAG: SAM hydroxide adenosyltransferase [Acidimicrobiales bacterium]
MEDGALNAEVLWVDHFGNAQLNVGPEELAAVSGLGLEVGEVVRVGVGEQVRSARSVRAYAELRSGQLGLVLDSYGLLSLSFDRRSAAEELGIRAGDAVRLSAPEGVG